MRSSIGFLLIASACTGTIDTGGGDDQPPPPPPVVDVQILVHDGITPQANVRTIFQNADGSTITEIATDATGLAKADMPDGGNLTVIRTYPTVTPARPAEVYTYVGVKPGDRLQLGHEQDTLGTPGAINVKVPTGAQGTIRVTTPCGSGQGTAPLIPLTVTGCPSNVTFFVTDQNQEAFIAQAAYTVNVDLSGQTLAGTLSSTISSSNVTPDITSINVEERIMEGTFALYSTGNKRIDTTPATVNLPDLHGVEEVVIATVAATTGNQMISNRQAYVVQTSTIDATAGLLPYVTTPVYTPTQITWVEQGTGVPDFVFATVDVTRPSTGGTPGPDSAYIRAIIAPHVGSSLTIPLLVGADTIYNPTMMDTIAGSHSLVKATGGYDAARARAFAVSSIVDVAPMNGSITQSYSGNTPPSL